MDNNDLQEFSSVMDMVRANYDKPPLEVNLKAMWIQQLGQYSIDQVKQSAMKHLRTSQFSPKLSDLISGLEGTKPKAREILAAARLKKTPFGVMAAGHIGSWDLNSLDDYALETRAQEVVDLYDGWVATYAAGDIHPRLAANMAKAGILMGAAFVNGAVPPSQAVGGKLLTMANMIIGEERAESDALRIEQERVAAIPPEQMKANIERMKALFDGVCDGGEIEPLDVYSCKCGYSQKEIFRTCPECGAQSDY